METVIGMQAAHAAIKIAYNNKSMLFDAAGMLSSFEYTDFLSGQVDDLQVSFKDPDGRWCNKWHPGVGAKLTASIVLTEGTISRELPCGDFTIDSPEYNSPGIITIKGLSASITTNLRRQGKIRQFKSITLKQLASKIAAEQGVRIHFVGDDTPPMSKVEQKNESDLKFLLRICKNEGYALKMGNGKTAGTAIVIDKLTSVDSHAATLTITRSKDEIIDWSFKEGGSDTYTACKVSYKHKDKGLLSATYKSPTEIANGQTLVIRQHCGSQAEAIRLAKAKLELANRNRYTCDMTLPGVRTIRDGIWFVSGLVVKLVGWGVYDGTYTVDQVKHGVGGGYRATLAMVKIQ